MPRNTGASSQGETIEMAENSLRVANKLLIEDRKADQKSPFYRLNEA